jgi:hypothetical protein
MIGKERSECARVSVEIREAEGEIGKRDVDN